MSIIAKLQALIEEVGEANIPYVSLAGTVNMAGGQPVSMENARKLYEFCQDCNIPVYLDPTRVAGWLAAIWRPWQSGKCQRSEDDV